MRKLLVLLLSSLSLSLSASLYVPEKLGSVAVFNSPQGFAVLKDNKIHHLGPEAVDSTLRKMDFKQRNMFMLKGGAMALNQDSEGQFHLKYAPKLKGGGALGAAIGCWIGKAAVYMGSYGAIAIISACTGPAAPITFSALATAWALPIEAASQGGAIAGGIIGGVATGPV